MLERDLVLSRDLSFLRPEGKRATSVFLMLKPFIVNSLWQLGIRVHRAPKLNFRTNPAVKDIEIKEILRAIKEECERNPNVRPSWSEAKWYLGRQRLSFYCHTLDIIEKHRVAVADRRVLEIGDVFGVLLRQLHRRYPTAQLCGTECGPKELAIGRRVCPQADLRGESIDTLSFEGLFDFVIMTEVLEHLADPYQQLARIDRLVRREERCC